MSGERQYHSAAEFLEAMRFVMEARAEAEALASPWRAAYAELGSGSFSGTVVSGPACYLVWQCRHSHGSPPEAMGCAAAWLAAALRGER